MKKYMLCICIMLFSSSVFANPLDISDVEYGYSAISITSADGLIGDVSLNVVDVGKVTDNNVLKTTNYKMKSTPNANWGEAKTGIGVIYTSNLVSRSLDQRLPLIEVGWRA